MAALLNNRRRASKKSVLPTETIIVQNEVLLNNRIEKYLQSVLRPIYLNERVLFAAKYNMSDNYITPHNIFYYLKGLFICLILRCYVIYKIVKKFEKWGSSITTLSTFRKISDCVHFTSGISLFYYTSYKYSQDHVSLVLKIQHACEILKIYKKDLKYDIFYSWLGVFLLSGIWVFSGVYCFLYRTNFDVLDILGTYSNCVFDISLLYSIVLIKLVTRMLTAWVKDVQEAVQDGNEKPKSYWKVMMGVYLYMMESYKMIETMFQQQVLLYGFHALYFGVINIAFTLEILYVTDFREDITSSVTLAVLIMQTWLVKSLIVLIVLSVNCERLYTAVDGVRFTCLSHKNSVLVRRSETQKLFFKNMERVHNAKFKKISLCGLINIDASFPLSMMDFIATCTVALLQFYMQ